MGGSISIVQGELDDNFPISVIPGMKNKAQIIPNQNQR